ncbi:MAG TPA: tetratricopeptide repeat protein [Acidimicrobiales bacterium]|nr:tetratricopeptide repeat protein [Acidimicrobiales bacterium]
MARKGARLVVSPDDRARPTSRQGGEPPAWEPEVWVEEHAAPAAAPEGRRAEGRPDRTVPAPVHDELRQAVGSRRAEAADRRMAEAVTAYERDRYRDALRLLKPLAEAAPTAPAVRELYGLTLYRLGRWAAAIKELEAFHALTGSYDQHPVLADCHRAAGHRREVERVWEELRRASPPAGVLAEGRIVVAATRADAGDLAGAIELLERSRAKVRSPRLDHLRQWYALADLYERAGDVPRARALFRSVLDHDPSLFDTAERISALGG